MPSKSEYRMDKSWYKAMLVAAVMARMQKRKKEAKPNAFQKQILIK